MNYIGFMVNKPQNIDELRRMLIRREKRTDNPDDCYLPTPEEIKQECLEIQKTWSPLERKRRNCYIQQPLIVDYYGWFSLAKDKK